MKVLRCTAAKDALTAEPWREPLVLNSYSAMGPQLAGTPCAPSARIAKHAERMMDGLVPIVPLQRQLYAHGAFMGLAAAMLRDDAWSKICQRVQPGLYRQAVAALAAGRVPETMLVLENSPVLAAYGTAQSSAPVPMEWDIWLHPTAPESLDKAKIVHGNAASGVMGRQPHAAQVLLNHELDGSDVHTGLSPRAWLKMFAQAMYLGGQSARKPVALYLDVKSTWSSAQDINACIGVLRAANVAVRGAGSFIFSQLEGLDVEHPMHLLHGVDGLTQVIEHLPKQAVVLFNGGALLCDASPWRVDTAALRELSALQAQRHLRVGLYLQETAAEPQAVAALTELTHTHPEIISLGVAYGGAAGFAERAVRGRGVGLQQAALDADRRRRLESGK